MKRTGILLVNLGTPSSPTPNAVRQYLAEFLSDRYVVNLPRLLWLPILYGLILPRRSPKSAALYASIWMDEGSPLMVYSQRLADKIQGKLGDQYQLELAMRYGEPSIQSKLLKFKGLDDILIVPLYPQYAGATVKTIEEKVKAEACHIGLKSNIQFLEPYYDKDIYIKCLADKVNGVLDPLVKPEDDEKASSADDRKASLEGGGASKLIFSFHGLPKKMVDQGDPYLDQCTATANALAEKLGLKDNEWMMTFQSRFGAAKWLEPYTDKTLISLAKQGIKHVSIMCPGFATDCLETLEEICKENKHFFLEAGGERFDYIEALNDSDAHAEMFCELIKGAGFSDQVGE